MRCNTLGLITGVLALTAAPGVLWGQARTETGDLRDGDRQLESGEYFDEYVFAGRAGQHVALTLTSQAFDTYLILISPAGDDTQNDDATQGETTRSLIEHTLDQDGEWKVWVTTFEPGESGAYELTMDLAAVAAPAAPAKGGRLGAALGLAAGTETEDGVRIERGALEDGDETLEAGEFVDIYTFDGRAGQEVVLDLQATGFDPYLLLRGPDQQSEDNDDHEGDRTRSLIAATLTESGTYRVGVTSYQAEERGAYVLRMHLGGER